MLFFSWNLFSSEFAAIPVGIGATHLLYYAIEGRKTSIGDRRTK